VKYEAALAIKPDTHEALYNWGVALSARARRASEAAEAVELLKAAEAKYEAALAIKPNDYQALHAFGSVALERAKRSIESDAANDLLKAAATRLQAARENGDRGIYNLACAYCLLGRADDCRLVLEEAEKAGTLPGAEHLEKDDDLRLVRELPWFVEIIGRSRNNSA
jgi:tetratricopeptide (TPR) repeat protein